MTHTELQAGIEKVKADPKALPWIAWFKVIVGFLPPGPFKDLLLQILAALDPTPIPSPPFPHA